jgi:hypothetical protein
MVVDARLFFHDFLILEHVGGLAFGLPFGYAL